MGKTLNAAPTASTSKAALLPVTLWACIGALVIAFEAYVYTRWISGPNFKIVAPGPTPMPDWMQPVLYAWQAAGIGVVLFVYYWFIVRPWRRERRVTTDGLLAITFSTLWFQDPLSAYFGHWFTYNTHLVNFGSWVSDVPGWQSFGEPGAMIAEPILLIGPVYVYFILFACMFGSFLMREAKSRWPHIQNVWLILGCFVVMAFVDLVGEGLVWLPLGFWEYPGGIPLMFSDTYHKFPLNEMLTIAASFTAITSLRYFKDDRGYTIVERGVEKLQIGRGRDVLRGLALIGAVHVALLLCYNVPNSLIYKFDIAWPNDLQERSYLTDNMCGPGTANLCPENGHGFVIGGRPK